MDGNRFSSDELIVLRTLFDASDREKTGLIHFSQLAGLLTKLGKNTDEIVTITAEAASRVSEDREGHLSFQEFYTILEQADSAVASPFEGPDPKVVEFLRILEEYRVKCEEEGNYLEAGRAHKQLGVLRKQEEKRQQKAVKSRQISERQDVQLAHNMQFSDFNAAWDSYIEEYDNMAQSYIQQMTERHATVLLEFQKQLKEELLSKPPKWSRELLDLRRKQHNSARSKAYAEAQKMKKLCDKIEEGERREMESVQAINFAKKEAKYRLHQQAELHALLKRIECRRKEHIKQRNLDSNRLLQRNRNVQTVLESKQSVESQRIFLDIKKNLVSNTGLVAGGGMSSGSYSNAFMSSSGRNYSNPNNSSGIPVYDPSRSAYAEQREKTKQRASSQSDINDAINRDIMAEFDDRSFFPKGDYQSKIPAGEMRGTNSVNTFDDNGSTIIENGEEEEEKQDGLEGGEEEDEEDYAERERERNEVVERGERENEGSSVDHITGAGDDYDDDVDHVKLQEEEEDDRQFYVNENSDLVSNKHEVMSIENDRFEEESNDLATPFVSFLQSPGPSFTVTA